MMPSASGVLRMRSAPNSFRRSWRLVATPSPNMITRGSRRISSASARPIASLTVIWGMAGSSGVNVGDELGSFRERRLRGVASRCGDALLHARFDRGYFIASDLAVREETAFEVLDRVALLPLGELLRVDVSLIVGLVVAPRAIGVGLEKNRLMRRSHF